MGRRCGGQFSSTGANLLRPLNLFFSSLLQAETDGTVNAAENNIVDSLAAKAWAIRLATEAAVSVLGVDSIIMSRPAGGPKIPQQAGNWDED
jgi:T-complex protein 1 subunit theta